MHSALCLPHFSAAATGRVDKFSHAFILYVMKSFSIMEAQHNLAALLREVEAGQELTITRRHKPVAKLTPFKPAGKIRFPDFKARAQQTWSGAWSGAGSDELLAECRGSR